MKILFFLKANEAFIKTRKILTRVT